MINHIYMQASICSEDSSFFKSWYHGVGWGNDEYSFVIEHTWKMVGFFLRVAVPLSFM